MALNDFLYTIDPNTMLLGLLFIIFYIFINFSLSKIFKNDKSSSTIVSLCVSLLAVYGINRTNFDLNGLLSRIGLNSDLIYTVVPWIILGLAILASFGKDANGKRKFRFYRFFMILGAFLILLSFFAYEQGVLMIIGIALILLGLFLFWRSKKKGTPQTPNVNNPVDTPEIRMQRERRLRSINELRQKYYGYSNEIKKIMAGRGAIPALNTPQGHLYHRYIQAMKAIENLAKEQGFRL
jgi:LPXTG-motif cell wall-anchored protein